MLISKNKFKCEFSWKAHFANQPTVVDLPNIHRESELAGTLAASADPDPGHLEFSEGLE